MLTDGKEVVDIFVCIACFCVNVSVAILESPSTISTVTKELRCQNCFLSLHIQVI